jgi:hypothetical protein
MADFDIANITETHPALKKLRDALADATMQRIPLVNIDLKPKRVAGVSTRAVTMQLEGSQTVTFVFRQGGDVYRVKINDKDFAFSGDLSLKSASESKPTAAAPKSSAIKQGGAGFVESKTFKQAINQLANAITSGQKAFSAKVNAAGGKTPPPRKGGGSSDTTPKNVTQKLKHAKAQIEDLDTQIVQKVQVRDDLKNQIIALQSRG